MTAFPSTPTTFRLPTTALLSARIVFLNAYAASLRAERRNLVALAVSGSTALADPADVRSYATRLRRFARNDSFLVCLGCVPDPDERFLVCLGCVPAPYDRFLVCLRCIPTPYDCFLACVDCVPAHNDC